MATIHRLEHATPRRQTARGEHAATTAEIILFPGVRYEHWSATQEDERSSRRRRPARDRLELAD